MKSNELLPRPIYRNGVIRMHSSFRAPRRRSWLIHLHITRGTLLGVALGAVLWALAAIVILFIIRRIGGFV